MKIACIIPTYNGKQDLSRLLDSLQTQTVAFQLFIVDSSSKDGTLELAKARCQHVTVIPSAEFNHGGTRQRMVNENPGYDAYVFLTQDAYLAQPNALANILEPLKNPKVGAVCGRQLPHLDATAVAQHARQFNYPEGVQVKSLADVPTLGIKTVFISNSFAAYKAEALQQSGGFPRHVIFAEDMYVVARMLLGGWQVAYAGNAQCYHSHNYTMLEEFERYFDMGVFHAREPWIRQQFGGAGGEGLRYIRSELRFLGVAKCYAWHAALLRNLVKLAGYKLGQQEARLPVGFKRLCGMYKRYWDGPFAVGGKTGN